MICSKCQAELPVGSWPWCPHDRAYGREAQPFDPVVVYRNPDGSYGVPGQSTDPTPAGSERVELRTIRDLERVQREMTMRARAEAVAALSSEQAAMNKVKSGLHAELRAAMRHMDNRARAFAEAALERSESKPERRPPDGSVSIEVLNKDASNRQGWRDERTGWKERRS